MDIKPPSRRVHEPHLSLSHSHIEHPQDQPLRPASGSSGKVVAWPTVMGGWMWPWPLEGPPDQLLCHGWTALGSGDSRVTQALLCIPHMCSLLLSQTVQLLKNFLWKLGRILHWANLILTSFESPGPPPPPAFCSASAGIFSCYKLNFSFPTPSQALRTRNGTHGRRLGDKLLLSI